MGSSSILAKAALEGQQVKGEWIVVVVVPLMDGGRNG
jgi:hypothetical protein